MNAMKKMGKKHLEHHPEIGDIESLKKKFASTAPWASE